MKNTLSTIFFACMALTLHAESVTLTREQAFRLHAALESIGPGLNPANAVIAADNITALAGTADSVRKGSLALQRAQARLPDTPSRQDQAIKLAEEFDAKAEEIAQFDLTRLDLSSEEIREAKVAPAQLAVIRQFLRKK